MATAGGLATGILRGVNTPENLTPAECAIGGERPGVALVAAVAGQSPTAADSARIFSCLRETVGDEDAEVRNYRRFMQTRAAAGNRPAQEVLALLEPWWSESTESVPPRRVAAFPSH